MNATDYFVAGLSMAIFAVLWLGFRVLPGERWQILAAIPVRKLPDGAWECRNLTWYGLIIATTQAISVLLLSLLVTSVGTPLAQAALVMALLLALCIPASAWIARIVDGKKHTFTVGGASFVGIVAAPWVMAGLNHWAGMRIEPMVFLAGFGVAYAIGESLGRLACISFGCCYGKPVAQMRHGRAFFHRIAMSFAGATRKTAYSGHLENVPLVPVQAMSAVVCAVCGLIALRLFLHDHFTASMLTAVWGTQIWRWLAEFLRADQRGSTRISAYQVMGALSALYAAVMPFVLPPTGNVSADLALGWAGISQPGLWLGIMLLWAITFRLMGVSGVTGGRAQFFVHADQV